MRILRGLSSRLLSCGCLVGVYQTYGGEIVGILDARGPSCAETTHATGKLVPLQSSGDAADRSPPAADSE